MTRFKNSIRPPRERHLVNSAGMFKGHFFVLSREERNEVGRKGEDVSVRSGGAQQLQESNVPCSVVGA